MPWIAPSAIHLSFLWPLPEIWRYRKKALRQKAALAGEREGYAMTSAVMCLIHAIQAFISIEHLQGK
jgi:hypothetical protein